MFGLKWSLWPVPASLAVQQNKAIFILTLYLIINDMKHFQIVFIAPQPCHRHLCCWLLPIWPKLDFWAENGAYGLCQFGWRYNGEKLYFSWPYMIVSMILNTFKLSASHLSRSTAIFVVDCCQFGPSWIFVLKWGLWPVPAWLAVQQCKCVFFVISHDSFNDMKYFQTIYITSQPCHSHLFCWWMPIWPYLDVWAENGAYGLCLLGWRSNGAKLSISWTYIIITMIRNTS